MPSTVAFPRKLPASSPNASSPIAVDESDLHPARLRHLVTTLALALQVMMHEVETIPTTLLQKQCAHLCNCQASLLNRHGRPEVARGFQTDFREVT